MYTKYLNILMLKTGDSYVAKQYEKYLKHKRKGKVEEKRNFYDRMNQDVQKRVVEESVNKNIKNYERFHSNISNVSGPTHLSSNT